MVVIIIVLIVLLLLSALFSATETAFSTINIFRIKQLAKSSKKGNKQAKVVYDLYNKFSSLLSTILVANNIVNMTLAAISSYFFASQLNLGALGVLLATLISSILVIIFGEIIPKTLAKTYAEKMSLSMAYPMKVLCILLTPLTYWFVKFDEHVNELNEDGEENVTATENELAEIVETIEREGVLEHDESELIKNAMNFDEITVKSVMVDKENVISVNINDSFDTLVRTCKQNNYSRMPVLDGDKAVGFILQTDVFKALEGDAEKSVKKLLNEPTYISYRRVLPVALKAMQQEKVHMAIVVDNQKEKNYLGIVTMEDVLEELVGEIYDEYDDVPSDVVEIGNNAFEVSGKVVIENFFDNYLQDVKDPETKQLYFGPWVKELLGESPIDSEIYYENLKISVLESKNGKIIKVLVEVVSAFDEEI